MPHLCPPTPTRCSSRPASQGTGGRTGIGQQSGRLPSGGEGSIGRGSLPEQPLSDLEPAPFTSRMDRDRRRAEGTGGRTSPSQQPAGVVTGARARGESGGLLPSGGAREGDEGEGGGIADLKPKRHKGSIAFGEGLEFTSDDGEFRLQFHNLTQAEYPGISDSRSGTSSRASSSSRGNDGTSPAT